MKTILQKIVYAFFLQTDCTFGDVHWHSAESQEEGNFSTALGEQRR